MKTYQKTAVKINRALIKRAPSIELKFIAWREAVTEFESDPTSFIFFKTCWLNKGDFSIYLRWSLRDINGELKRSLDIASVYIPEARQHAGWFRNFVALADTTEGIDGLYIEAVMDINPWLHDALKRWGFNLVQNSANNYWRPIQR